LLDADRFGMQGQCRCWSGSKTYQCVIFPECDEEEEEEEVEETAPEWSVACRISGTPREPSFWQSIRTRVGDPVLDRLQQKRTLRYSKYFSPARNCPGFLTTDPHASVKSRNPVGQNRRCAFLFPSQCLFFESFTFVLVVIIYFVRM